MCPCATVTLDDLKAGRVTGDVLANTTSVGMVPDVDDTPCPAEALSGYKVVFDAVRRCKLDPDLKATGFKGSTY